MPRNVVEVDPRKFPWLDLNRYTFCLGAESGGILYLAGQTASEYDPAAGAVVCKGDLLAQNKGYLRKAGRSAGSRRNVLRQRGADRGLH